VHSVSAFAHGTDVSNDSPMNWRWKMEVNDDM
jgi:hypothetical protein